MGRLRMAAATAVVAAVAAACSGNDAKEAVEPGPIVPGVSTTAPSFTGAGSESFCAQVGTVTRQLSDLATATDPDVTRTLFTTAQQNVASLAASAPPEIRPDMAVLADVYSVLLDGLRQADFDFTKLPPEVTRRLYSDEAAIASNRLNTYRRQVCGQTG